MSETMASLEEETGQVPDALADFLADLDEKDQAEGEDAANFGRRGKRAVIPREEDREAVRERIAVVGAAQATHKTEIPIVPKATR